MASFAGVSFEEMRQGDLFPRPESSAVLIKIHYPNGTRNAVQNLGRAARIINLRGLCSLSELNALYGKVAEVGSLTWSYTTMNVILESIKPGEVHETGQHFVDMVFTEVS